MGRTYGISDGVSGADGGSKSSGAGGMARDIFVALSGAQNTEEFEINRFVSSVVYCDCVLLMFAFVASRRA